MKATWIVAALLTVLSELSYADTDCSAAKDMVGRAKGSDANEAQSLLSRAIAACPSYEAYEEMGELLAKAPRHADRLRAVDAFVSADTMATTTQEHAETRLHYARLLDDDEDPENAYALIQEAQTLNPSNPAIEALLRQIEEEVKRPSQEHLTRGLWSSMYKPLRIASDPEGSDVSATEAPARPSVTIPIHFQTGSVMTDQETSSNIALLARVLADKSHPDQRYIFVGHADARGREQTNLELSRRRAEAIYQTVVTIEPTLSGRIKVQGRGSAEPINPGHDEQAYKVNRRLQVLLD